MKIARNKNGITIIMLVITITIMLILVSIAVFSSQNTTPEAKLAAAYSSLKNVKNACDNANKFIELNPQEYDDYYFFGHNIQYSNSDAEIEEIKASCGVDNSEEFSARTYQIAPGTTDETSRILENLELKGITSTYIVDLENEKYYILDGVENVNGEKMYEYREIMTSYDMLKE